MAQRAYTKFIHLQAWWGLQQYTHMLGEEAMLKQHCMHGLMHSQRQMDQQPMSMWSLLEYNNVQNH